MQFTFDHHDDNSIDLVHCFDLQNYNYYHHRVLRIRHLVYYQIVVDYHNPEHLWNKKIFLKNPMYWNFEIKHYLLVTNHLELVPIHDCFHSHQIVAYYCFPVVDNCLAVGNSLVVVENSLVAGNFLVVDNSLAVDNSLVVENCPASGNSLAVDNFQIFAEIHHCFASEAEILRIRPRIWAWYTKQFLDY